MFPRSRYARFQHIGWQEWNATGNVPVEQIPKSCVGSLHDLERYSSNSERKHITRILLGLVL